MMFICDMNNDMLIVCLYLTDCSLLNQNSETYMVPFKVNVDVTKYEVVL